jgi:hypothetical protein
MTTTDLIKILQRVEHDASGRPREISIIIKNDKFLGKDIFISESDITISSTGDGCAGAEFAC